MKSSSPSNAATSETLRLDPRSALPLHAQAEQVVRELIQRPAYRAGGLLPYEVSLSRSLGISRNTLRAAIGRLVTEGRLERKAGIGTRVLEPRINSGVGAWHSFTREMAAKGIKVDTLSVKVRPCPHRRRRLARSSFRSARRFSVSIECGVGTGGPRYTSAPTSTPASG
jgi:DNA-binding GntR family transcriptional regulator